VAQPLLYFGHNRTITRHWLYVVFWDVVPSPRACRRCYGMYARPPVKQHEAWNPVQWPRIGCGGENIGTESRGCTASSRRTVVSSPRKRYLKLEIIHHAAGLPRRNERRKRTSEYPTALEGCPSTAPRAEKERVSTLNKSSTARCLSAIPGRRNPLALIMGYAM